MLGLRCGIVVVSTAYVLSGDPHEFFVRSDAYDYGVSFSEADSFVP
jgi:hypothetical protein